MIFLCGCLPSMQVADPTELDNHSADWEPLSPSDLDSMPHRTKQEREGSPRKRDFSLNSQNCEIESFSCVLYGLILRFALAWFLPWAMDQGNILPGVAYTDIDYHVFTDAAAYVQAGHSPFNRTTYRYTPFLAALLAKLPQNGGRYLFCLADTLCGWIIVRMRRLQRQKEPTVLIDKVPSWRKFVSVDLEGALWWLYNPLAINICTRGSAESLIVLLPVLASVAILSMGKKSYGSVVAAGVCHGVAIHCKLYPIIYSLSFVCYIAVSFGDRPVPMVNRTTSSIVGYVSGWVQLCLKPAPILFALSFVVSATGLSWLAVYNYGFVALQEGLLYHFARVDHRHNYSMHWYWIYLGLARQQELGFAGVLLLLPQAVLLVVSSLTIAPRNLSLALFIQTFLFVAQNKVITAQYFTWYLCLLPLCSSSFALTSGVVRALCFLLLSIAMWLGSAFCLEMQGMGVHRIVWMMSVLFYAANVNLLGRLLNSCTLKTSDQSFGKVD